MKRIEMVQNIASEIILYNHSIDYKQAQEMAESILHRIEKDEMLPPSYNDTSTGINTNYLIHAWESEDE